MITVKLILSEQFPEKGGVWDDGDFAQVRVVSLTNRNIVEISNFELFDNITELNLQNNKIGRIENIIHLNQLKHLDLTDNLIDEEGLHAERLPANLQMLKLTGNPCLACPAAMEKLQQDYPLLQICVTAEMKESNPSKTVLVDDSDIPNPAFSPGLIMAQDQHDMSYHLDSEAVLREVVNRKCRLQSLVNINIDSTIQNLEKVGTIQRFFVIDVSNTCYSDV